MTKTLVLATRKSPLALAQANLVAARLAETLAVECRLLPLVSTGDRQTEWSLEQKGGKGLFTRELEAALLQCEADVAVHSAKDLPGDMPEGLTIAGYLPRADVRDVLVRKAGTTSPATIATGSPRRRAQLRRLFPHASFTEIRGNVDTRLNKIVRGATDATVLAAAGLARLGITSWPDLEFQPLSLDQMVPAIGQGAIAVQCRTLDVPRFQRAFDQDTGRSVAVERAVQAALGVGCHTATAAHVFGEHCIFFDERVGFRSGSLTPGQLANPTDAAIALLTRFGMR